MKKKQLMQVKSLVQRIYVNQLFLIGKARAHFFASKINQTQLDSMWQKIATLNAVNDLCSCYESTTASQDVDIYNALSAILYDFDKYCFNERIGTIGALTQQWPNRTELRQLLTQIMVFLQGCGLTDNHPFYNTPCYPELNPSKLTRNTPNTVAVGDLVITDLSNMRLMVIGVAGDKVTLTAVNREITRIQNMQVLANLTLQAPFFG